MRFTVRALSVLVTCLVLTGCFGRIQPVYSVHNHPVPASAEKLTAQKIGDVIKLAASSRKWVAQDLNPGVMKLTHRKKNHVAEVEVSYNKSSYSIKYLNSSNLLYNGSMIHRNYNRWVANLEQDIEMNLQQAALILK